MARNAASRSDAFTGYADGDLSAASANWSDPHAAQQVQVSTERVAGLASATNAPAKWAGTSVGSADQWASAVVTGVTGATSSYGAGVLARCSGSEGTRTFYYVLVYRNSVVELGKVVSGTLTVLHTASPGIAESDRIDIECEGTTIRACRNGTAYGGSYTVTDSDIASGEPGLFMRGDPSLSFADSWEAGTMAGSQTQAPRSLHQFRQRRR